MAKAVDAANATRAENGLEPLRPLGLHDARHTFGAIMRGAGLSRDDQVEYLGHARSSVTDRYTNPIAVEMRDTDNAAKLAEYLARGDTRARVARLEHETERASAMAPEEAARLLVERYANDPDGLARLLHQREPDAPSQ